VFDKLFEFEQQLADYTGAPYAVVTDGCTHALELVFRLYCIRECEFTAYTYLSIPQMLRDLKVEYNLRDEQWLGEYQFHNTNIWDSARLLKQNMYRPGQIQCLSFGHGKPLQLGKGGAILLDNHMAYTELSKMRSDGRDLRITPWQEQKTFGQGYHYCPTLETCELGIKLLPMANQNPKYHQYPDLRAIDFQE